MTDVSLPKSSFTERIVKENIKPEQLQKELENNNLVDIVVQEKDGLHVISGEEINLTELGKAKPNINIDELKKYDKDADISYEYWRKKDGLLNEDELKLTDKEADHKGAVILLGTTIGTAVTCAGIGSFVPGVGTVFGFTLGGIIGVGLGITAAHGSSKNEYKTPDWNEKSNIKTIK